MQTEGRVSDSEISAAISSLSWSPSRPNDSVLQNGMRKPIKGFVASPNEAFWKIFKQSKTQLRALGIHLIKLDGGSWRVFSKTKVDDIPEKLGGVSLSRSTGSDIDIPKPEGMDYLPFQKAGIEYSITHTNVLYGDEMGLGKTIQAIGAINLDRSIHRVLVVVPAYLKINWQREINRWYVIRPSRTFIVNAGDDFPVPERSIDKTDFIIINYDILPRYTKNISSFDACILDECHYIKGKGTKRSDAVMSLKTKVKRWFALSGTPALNRPIELFNVANLLAPDKFPNYFNYAKRYCGGMNTGWGFEAKGCTHPEELQLKLRASILVRRLKNEVLKELPPKRRQIIELPALPSVQMLLDEEKRVWRLHEDTIAALRERRAMAELNDNDAEYMEAGKMIAREFSVSFAEMALLRKKLADHKVPLVHSQILDCADSGVNKMIVFFHHKAPIRTLHGMLEREGMHPLIVTGDIDPKARQDAVDDFQTKDKHKVILGSIGAMGTGVTLTESSHVIFGELDWRPGILSQAEDRAHRIGQMNNVLIQYLLFADSLDAKMISSVIEKMEVLKSVLDDNDYDEDDDMPFDEEATKKKKPPLKGINDEKERELIHEAIRILANFDPDLARGRNNAGFNKFDSFIGHRLSQEHSLTPRAAAIGKRIIKKYRRQLEGLWDQIFPLGVD